MRVRHPASIMVVAALLVCSAPAHALEELADEHLSQMTAQDGVTTTLDYTRIDMDRAVIDVDYPTGPVAGSYAAYAQLQDGYITGVSLDGATTDLPANLTLRFDAGGHVSTNAATLGFEGSWSHSRLGVNAVCLGVRDGGGNLQSCQPGVDRAFGGMALDSAVSVRFNGGSGLFDVNNFDGSARLVINDGKGFFRQQTSEFLWKNLDIDVGYDQGAIGVDAQGLRLRSNRVDWNITYNLAYRGSAATPFSTVGATSLLNYGWSGGLRDFEARISGGGMWVGAESNRTQGLKFSWRNNFDTDFAWIIGDPSDSTDPRAVLHFTDWVNLPGALYTFDVPNVSMDIVRAGQSPGPISFLGQNHDFSPDDTAFFIAVRDLKFLGHNTNVRVFDPVFAGGYKDFGWGLIYTFGDLDANVAWYPGGRTPALTDGIRMDAVIAVKSPATWTGNTHFMIADTDENVGVGFINTDFLIKIDNAFLEMNSSGVRLAVLPDADEVTAGVQHAGDFSWRLKTTFGGGYMNNLGAGNAIEGFGLDLLLHASKLDLTFSPPTSGTYIGFAWNGVLVNDSYIKLSEPSKPDVAFTIGNVSGPLAVANGKIDLRAGGESLDGQTRLAFQQNLLAGRTASGNANDVLMGTLAVGNNAIGRLAIPGGNWYGGLALKQQ
jgi:hypothetical protein